MRASPNSWSRGRCRSASRRWRSFPTRSWLCPVAWARSMNSSKCGLGRSAGCTSSRARSSIQGVITTISSGFWTVRSRKASCDRQSARYCGSSPNFPHRRNSLQLRTWPRCSTAARVAAAPRPNGAGSSSRRARSQNRRACAGAIVITALRRSRKGRRPRAAAPARVAHAWRSQRAGSPRRRPAWRPHRS